MTIISTNCEANTTQSFVASLNSECDARIAYECSKNAANVTIADKVNAIRKSASHDTIASILIASSYNVANMNKQERVSNRRNVYAIQKEINIAQFIAAVAALNHYTLAIFKTAFALEKADFALTHSSARSACSKEVKCAVAAQQKIVTANRYDKVTDASTASTQSSSSINALQALNVFTESRSAANEIEYKINRESFAAQQIAKRLQLDLVAAQ